uniref:Uncharacterized protein n=1 Tax=viral metagenome TaxID=1070528 RepID=A0A6C0I9B9_9ZZZZ
MDISELPLPNNFENYDDDTQAAIIEYISHLSQIEKKAYKIAYNHLGSSFNVVKSNGYNDWLKTRKSIPS